MFAPREHENTGRYVLRWAARVLGAFCVGVLLLFFFGEEFDTSKIGVIDLVGLLFFPLGLIVGLVLGWQEEFWGGLIAAASVAGLYLIWGPIAHGSIFLGWWFLVFTIPGVLFLIYGVMRRADSKTISGN